MNIAVLSGKGGTGKTTVSTNLALALKANYVDCDVEEPNGFLFLKPEIKEVDEVKVDYPIIDKDKCTVCGKCVHICQFNALAKIIDNILLFDKLCHGCGACRIVCDEKALTYAKRKIGVIERGNNGIISCSRGILNIGEPMAVPVISKLLKNLPGDLNIIDCPPGTSCNVVASLHYADIAILVTEPTQFGLHDLKMAVKLVQSFKIPHGIVINKDDGKDNIIRQYCRKRNIKIIGDIPYSKDIAKTYSKGEIIYDNYKEIFDEIALELREVL